MPRKDYPHQREYDTWRSMKRRCYSPTHDAFPRYGGRGIQVCERWLFGEEDSSGFECFLSDMGFRPFGHSIDRINNDGNYEPNNCRWATEPIQKRSHRQRARGTRRGRTGVGWTAAIRIDGRIKHLGTFQTEAEAAASYQAARTAIAEAEGWA